MDAESRTTWNRHYVGKKVDGRYYSPYIPVQANIWNKDGFGTPIEVKNKKGETKILPVQFVAIPLMEHEPLEALTGREWTTIDSYFFEYEILELLIEKCKQSLENYIEIKEWKYKKLKKLLSDDFDQGYIAFFVGGDIIELVQEEHYKRENSYIYFERQFWQSEDIESYPKIASMEYNEKYENIA